MKKVILVLSCLCSSLLALAQVPNASFEMHFINSDVPKNWGNEYLHSMWMDSSGNWQMDSLLYKSLSLSPDAHSGSSALQLQNAYYYAKSSIELGKARCSQDSNFSAYVPSFESEAPERLHFWYKYAPVSGDTASVRIEVQDPAQLDSGQIIGLVIADTVLFLPQARNTYTYAELPITYFHSFGPGPKNITITFMSASESFAHVGSMLLVDDVQFDLKTAGIEGKSSQFMIYPNPVANRLFIRAATNRIAGICAYDCLGREVYRSGVVNAASIHIETGSWATGMYILAITDDQGQRQSLPVVKQ